MLHEILKYKKTLFFLVVVVCISGFFTYSYIAPSGFFSGLQNDLKTIEPSIEFSYTDLEGNKINLSDFKGKPLIINSWASWMPFSQTELPLLIQVLEEQGEKINILAINRMEASGVVQSFLSTFNIPLKLIFLLDPSDNFYKAVGGYAMPETLFYNAEGVLVAHKRGVLTQEELNAYVRSIIEE